VEDPIINKDDTRRDGGLRVEKKLQQEIVFGFQGVPKGGVDIQAAYLLYDGLFEAASDIRLFYF
jgi:hypothetical protein